MNFFKIDEKLATAAQPSGKEIIEKRDQGYSALVNLSPGTTPNFLPEEPSIAEEAGMTYIHYPVDCTHLKEEHYRVFSSIMQSLRDHKVLVHCGGNIKSSCLMHIYRVKELGVAEEESWRDLESVYKPEDKWIEYFQSWGLKGRPAA